MVFLITKRNTNLVTARARGIPDSRGIISPLSQEEKDELVYLGAEPNELLDNLPYHQGDYDKFSFLAEYSLDFMGELVDQWLSRFKHAWELRYVRLSNRYNQYQLDVLNEKMDEIEKPSKALAEYKELMEKPKKKVKTKKLKEFRWSSPEKIIGFICWECFAEYPVRPKSGQCDNCKSPLIVVKEMGG